jgi:hypothetical protein
MKRAALYSRISTGDQHLETQLLDLREMANGADAPDQDELREILWNIGQLLWIWDFYSGHIWALEHLTATSVEKAQSC